MESLPLEVAPLELNKRLKSGESLKLIDVRESYEFMLCRIEGAEPIPMGSVSHALGMLQEKSAEATLVLYCHHGVRSLQVASWLRQRGIARCQSLQGGIDRWAASIDPGLQRY